MKIAVIGANGQLGTDLCNNIGQNELVALNHSDIEITDLCSIRSAVTYCKPDVIINTAAFVRVDDCESQIDKCYRVNTCGARNVAVVAQELGAKLVFISTDYVFGGELEKRSRPYTEFDIPVPGNELGKAKLAGEKLISTFCNRHFIVRCSGLFGIAGSSGKGGNFIETIIRLSKEKGKVSVVNDQVFSPTYSKDLAKKILELVHTEYYGTFHITNNGICSWYEFADMITKLAGINCEVIPLSSDQYPQKAKRPNYSVMDNFHLRLLGFESMRPWEKALQDYLVKKGHMKEVNNNGY